MLVKKKLKDTQRHKSSKKQEDQKGKYNITICKKN